MALEAIDTVGEADPDGRAVISGSAPIGKQVDGAELDKFLKDSAVLLETELFIVACSNLEQQF